MLTREEEIPDGWRLASLHDTSKYEEEAREAITEEWGICTLVDGKICGPGYKFEIETGSFFDLGHKLVTNKGSGKLFSNTMERQNLLLISLKLCIKIFNVMNVI